MDQFSWATIGHWTSSAASVKGGDYGTDPLHQSMEEPLRSVQLHLVKRLVKPLNGPFSQLIDSLDEDKSLGQIPIMHEECMMLRPDTQ